MKCVLWSRIDQMKVTRLVLLLPAAAFLEFNHERTLGNARCIHLPDAVEQEGQCEGDARTASDENGGVIAREVWRVAIWTVEENLRLAILVSNIA